MTTKLGWLQFDNPWHMIAKPLRFGKLVELPTEDLYNTHKVVTVDDPTEAEVVTSQVVDATIGGSPTGKHKLLLDIDIPAALVPSTTPGHSHLYIDKELTWIEVRQVLDVLARVGIIQRGYESASNDRGFTCLRTPWTQKEIRTGKA